MGANTLWVKMGKHGPVFLPAPIQGVRQVGGEPMEVPDSRFIRRRLEVGDLVLVQPPVAPAPEVVKWEGPVPPMRTVVLDGMAAEGGAIVPATEPTATPSKKLSKEKE
jgi:hypothetical protein